MKSLGRLVLLVQDYDEAIAFYTTKLGFEVVVDIHTGERRCVHLRLPTQPDVALWLVLAETAAQRAQVGKQTAGQPYAVCYTDALAADYDQLAGKGVEFVRAPVYDITGGVAHFVDLYGNEFVLIELPTL